MLRHALGGFFRLLLGLKKIAEKAKNEQILHIGVHFRVNY